MATKKPTRSTKSSKKSQSKFRQLVSKATATRRAVFTTGLIGVLLFSGVGYYVIDRSSAITAATMCGSGYTRVFARPMSTLSGKSLNATLHLYGNGSTRTACAFVMSTGGAYGRARLMHVDMDFWRWPVNSSGGKEIKIERHDTGTYKTVAGPVKIQIPKNGPYDRNHLFIHGWVNSSSNMHIAEYKINNSFIFTYDETY